MLDYGDSARNFVGHRVREGGGLIECTGTVILAFGQGRWRLLTFDGVPVVRSGSPAARSSGGCGLASPVVPGGVSVLAVRVLTCSIVTVDATTMATARAIALKTKVVRFWSSIVRPPRNGSVARG